MNEEVWRCLRIGNGPQPQGKKNQQERKKDKKLPRAVEKKRVFSVLLSGYGGLVTCFSVRAKNWIRAHALARLI
jgi:hypothetical protein